MVLSENLSHMLQRLSCSSYNGKFCNDFNIEENDPASAIKKVRIRNVRNSINDNDKDWFTFDPDRGRCGDIITSILAINVDQNVVVGSRIEHLYHHKACDNIMIINNDNKLHVIYFEMKCGSIGYSYQFKSSRCLVRYIVDICNIIGGLNFEIVKEHYILFHNLSSLAKKPVSFQSEIDSIKKSEPDKPHKIYVSTASKDIQFNSIFV